MLDLHGISLKLFYDGRLGETIQENAAWRQGNHAALTSSHFNVRFVSILLQKSAATDGSFGHFAKDDRL